MRHKILRGIAIVIAVVAVVWALGYVSMGLILVAIETFVVEGLTPFIVLAAIGLIIWSFCYLFIVDREKSR